MGQQAKVLSAGVLIGKAHPERGEGAALGAALGALLLKELPPTRPPDLAARASSGTTADRSNDAARATPATLATCKDSTACFFELHVVTSDAVFRDTGTGHRRTGLLLPNTDWPSAGL